MIVNTQRTNRTYLTNMRWYTLFRVSSAQGTIAATSKYILYLREYISAYSLQR